MSKEAEFNLVKNTVIQKQKEFITEQEAILKLMEEGNYTKARTIRILSVVEDEEIAGLLKYLEEGSKYVEL